MGQISVGISTLAVSADRDATLVTPSLGSCIAVMAWEPAQRVGGMLLYMLPSSRTSPRKALSMPAMFADTGLSLLLSRMSSQGCRKEDLVIKVVGGGMLCGGGGIFDTGDRNYQVLRELLAEEDMDIAAEDVGGSRSRSARFLLRSGRVYVRSRGREVIL